MVHENAVNWSQGFWGSEHPDTAALRVKKEYVDKMIALKRENMDRVYAYLTGLIEKAKEELQHARGSNADHRRFALRQQIDEIVAYLKGQALDVPHRRNTGQRRVRAMREPITSMKSRTSSAASNAWPTSGSTAT